MKSMLRGWILAVVAPLALFGCADLQAPTSPADDDALFSTSLAAGVDLGALSLYSNPASLAVTSAKKVIGPAGGRLELHGFAVDVPAGAVAGPTEFQIRIPVESGAATRVVAEFLPHGAQFNVPVAIEFPFAGTSLVGAANPVVVWWNDGWINMGGAPTDGGKRLRTTTDHFSTYGTAEGGNSRAGGVVVAGG